MERRINIACFEPGSKVAKVDDIWQWDYGQILRIQGLSLPTAVEIHFSLDEQNGEAVRRIGITQDGVTDVVVPDSMLENESAYGDSYYFFAYIYLTDETSGNTEYKIRAKVTTRSKPEGYNSGDSTFAAILKTVNEIADDKVTRPETAKVGQVLSVKATDEEGKPTEFEAKDISGGVSDEKIAEAVGTYMEANPIEESDPTVSEWAKQPEKPSYTALEVGALPAGTKIPSKTSDLQNDSGFTTLMLDDLLTDNTKAAPAGMVGELKGDIEQLKQSGASDSGNGSVSVSAIQDINIKKWIGKKIIVDGSSITSGGNGNTKPTWFTFVQQIFALDTVYDHSLSGSNWLWGSAYASSYSRLDEYEDDADALIIMGDFSSSYSSLGEMSDVANVEGDTYYARLKGYASALIEKYPLCPIIWVIEPPRNIGNPSEMSDSKTRAEAIATAIKTVAEYYGFPVADCFHKTIFRQYNETNYAETTSDGTHPWNNIQRTMAQVIAETMKETPIIYQESYILDTSGNTGSGDTGNSGTDEDKTLTKITVKAVSGYTLYENDTLDNVKDAIEVIATYSDLSEAKITNYIVSGELVAGTQIFTIVYEGVSATIDLTVTSGERTITVSVGDLNFKDGYILGNNDNEVSISNGYGYGQDYIPVKPSTNITLTMVSSGWQSIFNCYDENKKFLNVTKGTYGTYTYTLPETAYYIRVNGKLETSGGVNEQIITYVPRN